MKKGRYQKEPSKHFPLFIALVAFLLLVVFVFMICKGCNNTHNGVPEQEPPTDSSAIKNAESIAIPGYEGLTLNANSKKQDLCLPNPVQNTCYFQISLLLEDGTILWQSELIKPGATSEPIVLETALKEGTYPQAVLRYSCFEMNEKLTPLNGAEIKVTLRVK